MNPGITAMLCILAFLILIYTGWFPALADDIGYPKPIILLTLCAAAVLTGFHAFPNHMMVQIHPGFLPLAVLFWVFVRKVRKQFLVSFFSLSLFLGSILFLWHELKHVDTDWADPLFRIPAVLLLVLIPVCFTRRFEEQAVLTIAAAMVTHFWILVFHVEMLKPLIIGNADCLDTAWICISTLFMFHYSVRTLGKWIRKRGKVGSI
ncbi:hypothetical protein ACFO25_02845 [Paenactinomyces guangxiensis]|uniref:Uncharacterized protein n=1 Tax=Paenactinomyces guangxiensis TaxID=1490290 RepID=A0A7W1WT58_9BACL|nr:hypothetical protein [Paenactinomyces guangxiensis]MBA4495621.1 hypothetical protein [Paenactinomyces guangxiensis]MBH8592609.1 hypothetical protein [Paenactinomyces guangxiensis]